jgi:hypothetical protein
MVAVMDKFGQVREVSSVEYARDHGYTLLKDHVEQMRGEEAASRQEIEEGQAVFEAEEAEAYADEAEYGMGFQGDYREF